VGARVAVAGASGYAGGELLRLLAAHPDLELGPVAAGSNAAVQVTEIHPHLTQLSGRTFVPTEPEQLATADLIFLALPHGQSATLAARLPGQAKVVDLGADFRLADPAAWARFYSTPYAGRWTYGLPELPGARGQISAASRVAAPGCYATAAILALAPLLAGGLAEPEDIVIVAASGTSGAGRAAKAELLGSEVMGAVSAYQAGGVHRHTPEIEQALGEAAAAAVRPAGEQAGPHPGDGIPKAPRIAVSFTPLLAPMPRGILATCTARLARGARTGALRDALAQAYAGEPFVHLLPEGRWPSTAATAGSNAAHLQVVADGHAGRAVVVAAIDNLGTGAAGQAVQNANLMLGLPETAGLTAHGVAP
jgi:N-acetyl-gamma-glutamyl-phosphate reductase